MNKYSLGAIKNPVDNRDIQLAQVQAPVALPEQYITDISMIPVLNQKMLGSCVGNSHAVAQIYNEYKENKKIPKLSPRFLYALSKQNDGIPLQQGTFPRVTAKIMFKAGCATETAIPNDTDLPHDKYIAIPMNEEIVSDAKPYRIRGYAEVAPDLQSLKQAIFQNGVAAITINVGNYDNPIKYNPTQSFGLHRVIAYGYIGNRILIRNSWGTEWGVQGNGYFDWETQQVTDCLAFVDLPNEIIEKAKTGYKYFSEKEIKGLKPELVKMLDIAREKAGVPFKLTSTLRSPETNLEAGGVPNSAHLAGLACDISAVDSQKRYKIAKALLDTGFKRIGIGKTFIHCDIDTTKPEGVVWLY